MNMILLISCPPAATDLYGVDICWTFYARSNRCRGLINHSDGDTAIGSVPGLDRLAPMAGSWRKGSAGSVRSRKPSADRDRFGPNRNARYLLLRGFDKTKLLFEV